MSYEHLTEDVLNAEDKSEMYKRVIDAVPAFFAPNVSPISSISNVLALIHEAMGNLWTGFYFVDDLTKEGPDLFLGLFQGSPACDFIRYGKGVCGTALKTLQTQIVPDVDLFPGHIACSSASRSEIVVPFEDSEGRVIGVLDVDSNQVGRYGDTDKAFLENLLTLILPQLEKVYLSLK